MASRAAGAADAARPDLGAATPDLGAAGTYLTKPGNLLDGHYYEAFPNSGGFADFGLTIDGALALAASRTEDRTLAGILGWLNGRGTDGNGRTVDDWTGIGTEYVDGGALAKEALLAEATGYNPRSFGGHDLIAALDQAVCTGVTDDCVAAGSYRSGGSVFKQALGVMAQLRSGDAANAAGPITFLLHLQHGDGSFPSLIPDSGESDVDSTAIAAMALALVPGQSAAVTKALTWLAAQQLGDGGFPGAAGDSVNSAAVAIQGLSLDATTYPTQLARARAFIAGQQNADGGFNTNAGSSQGSDLRASTQAVGGSVGTSFGTLYLDLPSAAAAAQGSAYLVSQLTGGSHLTNAYGVDYGLTADLGFALAASNDQDPALARVTGYLRAHVADYADPAGTGQYPGPYSGAVAKLALLAEVTGQDPRSFGGFDLLATLLTHVCTGPDGSGGNCTATGDLSQAYSTVSQALGVLALARAGLPVPAAVVSRLEELQCGDGGFSSALITAGATCTSDVDTTAYAAQALALVPDAASAVTAARGYLLDAQQPDGGFIGAAGENTNSTGLGLQALLATQGPIPAGASAPRAVAAGTDPQVAGRAFLVSQQLSNGGFRIGAGQAGADVRASTQAVPALVGATLAALSDPVTPVAPPVPVTTPSGGSGPSSAPAGGSSAVLVSATAGSANPSSAGALANTGASTTQPLRWALGLLVAGAAAMLAGRRRVRPAARRTRPVPQLRPGRRH